MYAAFEMLYYAVRYVNLKATFKLVKYVKNYSYVYIGINLYCIYLYNLYCSINK